MDALHLARESGLAPSLAGRSLQCILHWNTWKQYGKNRTTAFGKCGVEGGILRTRR